MDYNEMQKRIAELETENAFLKSLLEQANISYTLPEQEQRIIQVEITHNLARRFFLTFGVGWMCLVNDIRIKRLGN